MISKRNIIRPNLHFLAFISEILINLDLKQNSNTFLNISSYFWIAYYIRKNQNDKEFKGPILNLKIYNLAD